MAKNESELTWKDIEVGGIATEPGSARNIRPATGVRSGPPITMPGVSNAAYARSIVPRVVFSRTLKASLKPLCSIARVAASAPGSARQG